MVPVATAAVSPPESSSSLVDLDVYRRVVALMPAAVYLCEAPSAEIVFFNDQAAALWGRRPRLRESTDRFCGSFRLWKTDGTCVPHDECPMAVALRDGRSFRNATVVIERPDGTRVTVLVNIDPIRDERGAVVGAINVFHDMTELTEARKERRKSERRFRQMIDALPAAIYTTDAQGRLTHFNPACVEFSGRHPKVGSDEWCVTWKLYHPDGTPMPHDTCPMAIALKEGRPVFGCEAIAERPDGTRVWFTPYPTPLRDETGEVVGGINMLVDITERKQAEETRARLAAIVESSDDAIIGKDLDGTITSWNAGAERLYGYTAEETVGRPVTMLIPPDRADEEPAILDRLRRGERIDHYETVRRRKDGSLLDVSLTVSPVRDAAGRIVGASKIARDITDRKRAQQALEHALDQRTQEVTVAQRRLATTERMAAVGTLASGLAHDMNNVLLPLGMRLDLLINHLALDGATHDHLVAVQGLLGHLREMSRNLALFSRDPSHEGVEGETELVDWHKRVWRFIDASMRTETGANPIRLDCDLPVNLPSAPVAPHRLTQAVLNLLHNARHAILAARANPESPAPATGHITLRARRNAEGGVSVQVIDDGCGMDAETKRRCIEPFFTTRSRSDTPGTGGSGLGLALVLGTVERAGGRLEIESAPGQGTTVTMVFPPVTAAGGNPASHANRIHRS